MPQRDSRPLLWPADISPCTSLTGLLTVHVSRLTSLDIDRFGDMPDEPAGFASFFSDDAEENLEHSQGPRSQQKSWRRPNHNERTHRRGSECSARSYPDPTVTAPGRVQYLCERASEFCLALDAEGRIFGGLRGTSRPTCGQQRHQVVH